MHCQAIKLNPHVKMENNVLTCLLLLPVGSCGLEGEAYSHEVSAFVHICIKSLHDFQPSSHLAAPIGIRRSSTDRGGAATAALAF